MIQIPKQLKNYRFIKTYKKKASEKAWPVELTRFTKQADNSYINNITGITYRSKGDIYKGPLTSYSYNDIHDILKNDYLKNNNNVTYGLLCGYNGLIVVDLDSKAVAEKLRNIWPFSNTFSVLSAGKKLPHFYFKCKDYSPVTRYDNSNGKRLLDVQGTSTYVIGPNSCIKTDEDKTCYKVSNDENILEIDYEKLISIIEENIGPFHKIQKKQKNPFTNDYFTIDPINAEIFKKITCDEVLDEVGIDISNNPGDTPFADSVGGKCLHRTNYLWFDHHIQEGGDVIQLYAKINDIDYLKAKYELAEKIGITDNILKNSIQYYIKNKQEDLTEMLSMKFKSTIPVYVTKHDKFPEIFTYKEGIYVPEGESVIKEFCDRFLGKWYTSLLVKKIVDKIIVRSFIDTDEFYKEAPIEYIPVQNGILNIITKQLLEFTPDMRFFNKLPVKYDPTKNCEVTLQHYNTILNGVKDVQAIQELYGYLLYRDYRWEKAFMFFGDGGNGKSKSIEQIKCFLGDHNCVNLSLQQLQNEKFLRCNLHRKLANLADDIGQQKLDETQMFKQLTGHSSITVDRKHKNALTFTNYAKQIFSANKLPSVTDNTSGFLRRWITLGFTKKFLSPLEYKKRKEEGTLKPHYRIADTTIIRKLTEPDELSGVLNWALDGLNTLINNNGFSKTDSEEQVKKFWARYESSAFMFLQDKVEITNHPDDYEIDDPLYEKYVNYCIEKNVSVEDEKKFKRLLQQRLVLQRKKMAHGYEYRWLRIKYRGEK